MTVPELRRETQFTGLSATLLHGVTVIVPAYKSAGRIGRLMDSLSQQTLSKEAFEVIVVVNGDDDGTFELLAGVREQDPQLQLRVIRTLRASAGDARNLGLAAARMAYVTFVDDDDLVESDFLRQMLERAEPGVIVIAPLRDIDEGGATIAPSSLVRQLADFINDGMPQPLQDVPWVLKFNACKLIPAAIALQFTYQADLTSGEDVAYMANLLLFDAMAVPVEANTASSYVRVVRDGSVSRQAPTWSFMVDQRLGVIKAIVASCSLADGSMVRGASSLVGGQASFINTYCKANPDEFDAVADAIEATCPRHFPWSVINAGRARDLAILYCFPPFQDTSAVVGAKVIRDRRNVVDVIYADMSAVRVSDLTLAPLADRWIDQRHMVHGPATFADWTTISNFAVKATEQALNWQRTKGPYRTMYSRALWLGSHVAAALVKTEVPKIAWTAEFSDPLAYGIDAKPRAGVLADNPVNDVLRAAVRSAGIELGDDLSLFEFVEQFTIVLADVLIFTNVNQRDFVLSKLPAAVAELGRAKAVVRPHPSPPAAAYGLIEAPYETEPGVVNIGYFGRFYGSRTMEVVFEAIGQLPEHVQSKLALHVFCDDPEQTQRSLVGLPQSSRVRVSGQVPYMQFLNLAGRLDALIVQDAQTEGAFDLNPFLPSKLSDYRGAGALIWGIVEAGSPLSGESLDYTSPVGDRGGAREVLAAIVADVLREESGLSPADRADTSSAH